jgi:hypothetical protein
MKVKRKIKIIFFVLFVRKYPNVAQPIIPKPIGSKGRSETIKLCPPPLNIMPNRERHTAIDIMIIAFNTRLLVILK